MFHNALNVRTENISYWLILGFILYLCWKRASFGTVPSKKYHLQLPCSRVFLPGCALSYCWICRPAAWLKRSLIKKIFLENFNKLSKQRWPGGMVWQCWSCVDCMEKALPLSLKIEQFTRIKQNVSFDLNVKNKGNEAIDSQSKRGTEIPNSDWCGHQKDPVEFFLCFEQHWICLPSGECCNHLIKVGVVGLFFTLLIFL